MNNQLPKTICFICGAAAMIVYAIRGFLCHILNRNMGCSMMTILVVGNLNVSRRHIQPVVSSRRHYVPVDRMLDTCLYCACSRGSGTLSISLPLNNT